MAKRRDISKHSKDKLASGLLGGAVVTGLVSGLAAASLGGVPTASATCIGISGINIGAGCVSTFGNFALVLGTGTAETAGFLTAAIGTGTDVTALSNGLGTLAYAGGSGTLAETNGILNLAAAGLGFAAPFGAGTNVEAVAGRLPLDFVNIAVNIGDADPDRTSLVDASFGAFNLAGNLFGNANNGVDMTVFAGGADEETLGFGTVAANVVANRSDVQAIGTLVNATNWGTPFSFPQASDSTVHAGTVPEEDGLPGAPTSLSWAFNYQGIFTEPCDVDCGNTVTATGPGAIAGAIGVVKRNVDQPNFGISIATQFNDTGIPPTNVLAASGTQANRVGLKSTASNTNGAAAGGTQGNRVRLNSTGTNTNGVAASGTQGNRVRSGLNAAFNRPKATSPGASALKSVTTSTKKVRDTVSRGTSGLAKDAKAGADSTSSSDN
jgi:hypothetical protein